MDKTLLSQNPATEPTRSRRLKHPEPHGRRRWFMLVILSCIIGGAVYGQTSRHNWDGQVQITLAAVLVTSLIVFLLLYAKQLSWAVRACLWFVLGNAVGVHLLLTGAFKVPFNDTTLHESRAFLMNWEADDAWRPLLIAHQQINENPSDPVYGTVLQKAEFQYPPFALFVGDFLRWRAPGYAYTQTYYLTGIAEFLSWAFVAVMIFFLCRILAHGTGAPIHGAGASAGVNSLARWMLAYAATVSFYPAMASFGSGQIQTWINALLTAAIWFWISGKPRHSGFLVGLCTLIKPYYGLLVVWALFRKRRVFAKVALATVLAGPLLSVWRFGWNCHLEYVSLFTRIFSPADYAPFQPFVFAAALLTTSVIIATLLLRPEKDSGGVLDFSAALLACTMASSVAWVHHYGVLLPVFAVLFAALSGKSKTPRLPAAVLLALAFLLTSHYLSMTHRLSSMGGLNLFQNHLFFGALIVLFLCYWLRQTDQV